MTDLTPLLDLKIADSGSMEGERWGTAREALKELVHLAKDWDSNGIDIHFLNNTSKGVGIKVCPNSKSS